MAKIVSLIQYVGKAGNTVGQKGPKGGIIFKQKAAAVANPRTDAQMAHRAKMKLAAQVAAMLGELGRTSLVANGYRKSERGMLIKRLLKKIVVNANGSQASLAYDLHLVDSPVYLSGAAASVAGESTSWQATFSGVTDGQPIAKAILLHDITTGTWRHTAKLDTSTFIAIPKSDSETDDALEIFAYGIVLQPRTSDAVSSVSDAGTDQNGFTIDLNRVTLTDFDFSHTISARLSVNAANGSSSGGDNNGNGGNGGSNPPSGDDLGE